MQDDKPSIRQVYGIARALLDIAGLSWPTDRQEASALITTIREQREALAARTVEVPF